MSLIFVSHSNDEDEIVTRIHDGLTAAGFETWVDHARGIGPDDNPEAHIRQALRLCEQGLFILSPRSIESKDCCFEWETILDMNKPLTLAVIRPVDAEKLPSPLRSVHRADLSQNFEAGLADLIQMIHQQAAQY